MGPYTPRPLQSHPALLASLPPPWDPPSVFRSHTQESLSSLLRLRGRFGDFLEELNSFPSPQIPQNLPCSVTLQPGPEDTGKVGEEQSSRSQGHP